MKRTGRCSMKLRSDSTVPRRTRRATTSRGFAPRSRMTQQDLKKGLGSHCRKWLALAALCAMPIGVAAALAADSGAPKAAAPASTKSAATVASATAPDKKEQKKEDPKAWKVAEG